MTVTDAKLLLVNRAATEALGLPRRVLLYFDRKGRRAGIRGTEEEGSRPTARRPAPTAGRCP